MSLQCTHVGRGVLMNKIQRIVEAIKFFYVLLFCFCNPVIICVPFQGLRIPANCELVVGGEPQCWAEGHCLLFDDSFLHTAFHEGRVQQISENC